MPAARRTCGGRAAATALSPAACVQVDAIATEDPAMAQIEMRETVRLNGLLDQANASGLAVWRDRLLVVSDELTGRGNVIQAFEPDGTNYRAAATNGLTVLDEPGAEPQE